MLAYLLHVTENAMPRWMQFAIFFIIVTLIYSSAHYYVYRRIAATLIPGSAALAWLRATAFLLALSFPVARLLVRTVGVTPVTTAIDWFACVWMGMLLYSFLLTAAAHEVSWTASIAGFSGLLDRFMPARTAAGIIAAAVLAVSAYGYHEARWKLERTELEIPVKNLPAERDGFRIVQISDVHIGVIVSERGIERLVREINALSPDLVVITGDLVDEDAAHVGELAEKLEGIRSRYGVLAVTGNHEFYAGVERVVLNAMAGGVRFLRNRKETVAGFLDVYGADDPTGYQFGGVRAAPESIVGPEARERPSIFLYHQPVRFEQLARAGIDLVLSGHTHNGQIWPIHLISGLIYPHRTGLFKSGGATHYVSRGAGTWGPPMRIGSTPEIVSIKLKKQ
jgi:predicted MPP superfamily phosphohydrolase